MKTNNKENINAQTLDMKNRHLIDSWIADIGSGIKDRQPVDQQTDQLSFSQDASAAHGVPGPKADDAYQWLGRLRQDQTFGGYNNGAPDMRDLPVIEKTEKGYKRMMRA